jgi:hypothetical protein
VGGPIKDVLTPAQRNAIRVLSPVLDPSTYLAGGVAVGLRLRHRRSRDLDLFTPEVDPTENPGALTRAGNEVRITGRASGTLYLEVQGVPASLIRYAYPLLAESETFEGIGVRIASLEDLACMKLSAIASRGAARDFWDLDEILRARGQGLEALLDLYRRKYSTEDIGHVVRSLAYFADADAEPRPEGLTAENWAQIKANWRARVLGLF